MTGLFEYSENNPLTKARGLCVSYCMVCAYVREDNPRTLASGLSPVHAHNHTITAVPYCTCMHVLGKPRILSFSPSNLTNSIKHEQLSKILNVQADNPLYNYYLLS